VNALETLAPLVSLVGAVIAVVSVIAAIIGIQRARRDLIRYLHATVSQHRKRVDSLAAEKELAKDRTQVLKEIERIERSVEATLRKLEEPGTAVSARQKRS
jgi:Tfp pilus assembly protein PilN